MRKWRNKQGMTMAELLIVVAIIGVLSGVAFIAVWNYQRSMGQLERDGIAKQIFIAAQNHLAAARGEGYLGISGFGTKGKATDDVDASGKSKGNYYFVVTRGSVSAEGTDKADEIFDLMLPLGALDETIRASGSYLIRYNKDSGTVMDVFYCTTTGSPSRFNHTLTPGDEYVTVLSLAGEDNKSQRRTYVSGDNSILGWYGGAKGIPHGEYLSNPLITIHNEELLWVDVSDANQDKGASLQLKIKGETSGAEMVFILRKNGSNVINSNSRIRWVGDTCHVVLDDITSAGQHFLDINSINSDTYSARTGTFIWGENIKIQAIAYNEEAITNMAYSEGESDKWQTTNSLFDTGSNSTALISNFRHFENLDRDLSGYEKSGLLPIAISNAQQTTDMIWNDPNITSSGSHKPEDFIHAVKYIKAQVSNKTYNPLQIAIGTATEKENCLHPVCLDYKLSYEGNNKRISSVTVDMPITTTRNNQGNAGLFGTIEDNRSEIRNVELLDFSISGTSNSGTLAGAVINCSITNVLAHDSNGSFAPKVRATSGNTGGLIGTARNATVTKSAAAVVVEGGTSAGGLIGTMTGGTVRASYAGGHTNNATYFTNSSDPIYNVTGGTAGGLIGSLTNGTVTGSYSTCSASGTTAGGFVGKGDGSPVSPVIKNCYCTGLVLEPKDSINSHGAFAGSLTGTTSNCQYFEIINEIDKGELGFDCLSAIGGGASQPGISAFDETAASYEAFCNHTWKPAKPYDPALMTLGYYNGNYNLMTVDQLNETLTGSDKVNIMTTDFVVKEYSHYGDWPAPEAFVINK